MKKSTIVLALLTAGSFVTSAFAQDNFSLGTDYHLIYLDDETADAIPAEKIKKDLRADDISRFLYVWADTYTGVTAAGPNWNGVINEYVSFQVASVGWSGLGFSIGTAATPADLTAITKDFTFHIACKTTNTASHLFGFDGDKDCTAKIAIGATPFVDAGKTFEPYADFARDGQWHLIEIPVDTLFKLGLKYTGPTTSNVFWMLSGGVTGTNISMDAIFFYKKGATGIQNASVNKLDVFVTNRTLSVPGATTPIELYSLTGVQVKTTTQSIMDIENIQPGIYLVKCNGCTQKVQIK